jgi:hypothetical protein
MYYYYSVSLLGIRVWWKQFLTTGQIVQFLMLLTTACVQLYWRFTGGPVCSGDLVYTLTGFGFVISLVVLFVQFFRKTYSNERQKRE